jgi:uncharacterized protein YajQ (UPF0234 family)
MPSFDVVSEVDLQEVRNAVDQARREVGQRFDFKGTDSGIELSDDAITLASNTEQKLEALRTVLDEKLVRRKVSLKALASGRVEDAAGGSKRQVLTLNQGISTEKGREIVKFVKDQGLKKVQVAIQGDQVRISGKNRDDLQAAMHALREHDFEIPLQFTNRRD